MNQNAELTPTDIAAAKKLNEAYAAIRKELATTIVGQEEVLEQLLMCIFARGHAILEGVPGLAKTLMVSSLASCLDLKFARVQFTPDLMPSDITGTEVIQEDRSTGQREFKFLLGPIFNNVILADEINRTPPKTQAALLEAMQERQVTTGGVRRPMQDPFFVLATQNPIEQEGTYPLPEAQQDRFMFKIFVKYPKWEDEFEIIRRTTTIMQGQPKKVLDGAAIIQLQDIIRRVPVAPHVIEYAMRLVRATRVTEPDVPEVIKRYVSWGAGPRACQFLILGGKVRAVLQGRSYVSTEDIQAVALPVMRHRIVMNFNADADGYSADRVVEELIATIPAKESEIARNPATSKAVQ